MHNYFITFLSLVLGPAVVCEVISISKLWWCSICSGK